MHPLKVASEAIENRGALQKQAELTAFLSMLADLQPQVIVEVGCDAGGTLWAWTQLTPKPRRIIGVDLPRGGFHSGHPLKHWDGVEDIVIGDSHAAATFDKLVDLLGDDRPDLLFIDADHTYEGAKADFETYGPLVRPGGIIALHDICNHPNLPQVDVFRLWQEIRQSGLPVEELVTDPPTWGGIGVVRLVAEVAA